MKVIIVRHAKTEYNEKGLMQGVTNIPLSDAGRIDAKMLRSEIKDEDINICFSSPLVRAFETAMILVGDKVEIRKDPRLIERNLGELEEKDRTLYDFHKYWDYSLNSSDLGVEPIKDIIKRVEAFIDYLKTNYPDKTILIVSHGAIVRTLHYLLNNIDISTIKEHIDINNCYIEKIEIN